jgi:hypothetical protein
MPNTSNAKRPTPVAVERVVGRNPPEDGREWEGQCARCGSSISWEECENCGGEGVSGHDCGEDCCCCADPEENVQCDACRGRGGFNVCVSTPEWCQAHPSLGRRKIKRGVIEWFTTQANTTHQARAGSPSPECAGSQSGGVG